MSDKIYRTKVQQTYVYPIPDATVSASHWFDISVPVKAGDNITWTLQSSATSGAFTLDMTGSISGLIAQESRNHTDFNNPSPVYSRNLAIDETISIGSYTNTATTFSHIAVTVTRTKR